MIPDGIQCCADFAHLSGVQIAQGTTHLGAWEFAYQPAGAFHTLVSVSAWFSEVVDDASLGVYQLLRFARA